MSGALILTGAPGSGKSSVLEALSTLLEIENVQFGAIESEQLARGWPWLPAAQWTRQLAAVIALQRDAGRNAFLVAATTETEAELRGVIDAIGADPVVVVCLSAPPDVVAGRIAEREPDSWPGKDGLIQRARELSSDIPAIPGIDLVLSTAGRRATDIAAEVRELIAARGVLTRSVSNRLPGTDRDRALIGGREQRKIVIVDYDSAWPGRFDTESDRIRRVLGTAALRIEHVGSTAVPGLAAKPIIDILVTVEDPDDEGTTVPAMASVGYELRVREPGHRLFRTRERDVHVHVWGESDPEVARYLGFRDWLRKASEDREAYETLKRELASREWGDMNEYADAKTDFIEAILAKHGA